MNRAAMVFLILLRMAIGWHFFFEGVQKVESVSLGETTTNKPFSSAAYFREATGPAGPALRAVVGDPDAEALALLDVAAESGKDGAVTPPHERTPPALTAKWNALLAEYERHYNLSESQRKDARVKLEQSADGAVLWLTQTEADETTPEQTRKYSSGEVKRRIPTAERIKEYRARLAELNDTSGRKLWLFGRDVERAKLRQAKGELTAWRASLVADLDAHTHALMRSFNLVVAEPVLVPLERLDDDLIEANELMQEAEGGKGERALESAVESLKATAEVAKDLFPLPAEKVGATKVTPIDPAALRAALLARAEDLDKKAEAVGKAAEDDETKRFAADLKANAKDLSAGAEALPEVKAVTLQTPQNRALGWLDFLTRWGLVVGGGCLLVGLFTRTNAWLAAGFLLMTYLAMPAFPWLPSVGPSEGNYLFVNKNVVEMLALCVLGATATGRWFGVDAIIGWFFSGDAKK